MRKFLIAAVALVLAVGGWWYFSPYWTLHAMRSAAQRGDAKKLSEYVDYPAVREDLKGEFRRTVFNQAAAGNEKDGFAVLGSAFALAMIDPLVDAVVTPEGLEAAFARQQRAGQPAKGARLPAAPSDPVIDRQSFDRFTVRDKDPSKGALVFARSGLGWKLVGFDLPEKARS